LIYGDDDGDRIVNAADLLDFRQAWLSRSSDDNFIEGFDSNLDGRINAVDLLGFRTNWLKRVDFI